ncbi:glycoside hydrolase family 31 protein [Kocuria coralli]|uniref:glycoside hydrolase family 31 protein n=1 Tax=Kocuria coralli TaxID=1461025 RepID=UPI001FE8A3B0|nr:glycoside hydrolase family 31 protein [Kocuria coralli]
MPNPATTPAEPLEVDQSALVEGPGYRITVLTSRLLRLEFQEDGVFTDAPTQLVRRRRFPVPEFTVTHTEEGLDLWTEDLHLRYDRKPFSPAGLSVSMRRRAQGSHRTTWHYGDPAYGPHGRGNLGGTARTLDDVDGAVDLEPGLLSENGYAVVDDSHSLLLAPDGWVSRRPAPGEDLYFFGYGRDYTAALKDYFALTGPSPLLPRWALGNWWSRYHRYSADDYLALMDRFREAGIPFSVAVLDMDWHLVDIDPALGSGWTGYTWNTELFPDPAAFLRELHERGLRVTLNVHPADGVRSHEAAYADVARDLGLDPETGLGVPFDITSRAFVDAYFKHLHHPHEDIGVDFWWLDWQSGSNTRVPGLDPLWMLNHVHYRDSARKGRRPLTFSRYAGLGSHRYPIGFSGDAVTSWASLDFQPYFTATAANAGYFWWSHDIGGHLGGIKDNELAARWYQLGVFSPINRLHSSSSPFNSKEPWRFGSEAQRVMTRYLRLRHRLVPYLYSAMWRSHTEGKAPVQPMYHRHPRSAEAYEVPNQYMFGPDLLVAPITTPADRSTHHARTSAWLPQGTWYDFFDGRRYDGGRVLNLHRDLEAMPVLAAAGSIIPLASESSADAGEVPGSLLLKVFPGADGACTLVEDDGSDAPERQETVFSLRWAQGESEAAPASAVLTVAPPAGPGVLTRRALALDIMGAEEIAQASSTGAEGDESHPVITAGETSVRVDLGDLDLSAGLELRLDGVRLRTGDQHERIFRILDQAEIEYDLKSRVMDLVTGLDELALLSALHTLDLPGNLQGVLVEVVTATTTPRRG